MVIYRIIDLDGNGTDELLVLRFGTGKEAESFGVKNDDPIIVVEVYKTEKDQIVMYDSKPVYKMFYCQGSNLYMYFSEQLKKYCLVCESGTLGNMTRFDDWVTTIYTVTVNSIDEYANFINSDFAHRVEDEEFIDIDKKMLLIGAPYAEYSTTYAEYSTTLDNRTSASYYKFLCQIKHDVLVLSEEESRKYHSLSKHIMQVIPGDSEAPIKNKPDSYFKNKLKAEKLVSDNGHEIITDITYEDLENLEDILDSNYSIPSDFDCSAYSVEDMIESTGTLGSNYFKYFPDVKSEYSPYDDDFEVDPLKRFPDAYYYKYEADKVDWIMKNIYHLEPISEFDSSYSYLYKGYYYKEPEPIGSVPLMPSILSWETLPDGKTILFILRISIIGKFILSRI